VTQLELEKHGTISARMAEVARREMLDPEMIRKGVAVLSVPQNAIAICLSRENTLTGKSGPGWHLIPRRLWRVIPGTKLREKPAACAANFARCNSSPNNSA
jgi:hypothetical protein